LTRKRRKPRRRPMSPLKDNQEDHLQERQRKSD